MPQRKYYMGIKEGSISVVSYIAPHLVNDDDMSFSLFVKPAEIRQIFLETTVFENNLFHESVTRDRS